MKTARDATADAAGSTAAAKVLPPPSASITARPSVIKGNISGRTSVNHVRKQTVLEAHGYTNLQEIMGSGAYATVRKAYSQKLKSHVAVKIISKFQAPDDYLMRFLPRELEVVKGLRHPNLINFLHAIETTHRIYLVMEYTENGNILDVIKRDRHIDEPRARIWFRQLVEAVNFCHSLSVVHRDLKCENLLLDSNDNIKLSDFGFARCHKISQRGVPEMIETFCGSLAYIAPEILRGTPYNPRMSDVWSTGVVLFAMVFGRFPFDPSSFSRLLRQAEKRVALPRSPRVSNECKDLIVGILAKLCTRLKMPQILTDKWLQPQQDALDSTQVVSKRHAAKCKDPHPKKHKKIPKQPGPIALLTKDVLKKEGEKLKLKREPGRRSTLNEQEVLSIEPTTTKKTPKEPPVHILTKDVLKKEGEKLKLKREPGRRSTLDEQEVLSIEPTESGDHKENA